MQDFHTVQGWLGKSFILYKVVQAPLSSRVIYVDLRFQSIPKVQAFLPEAILA